MPAHNRCLAMLMTVPAMFASASLALAQSDVPTTANRPVHQESAMQHEGRQPQNIEAPPLPEDMTLDEVLDYSASPPPAYFPETVPDDRIYVFTFLERFEYRVANDNSPDHLGWEAQGWVGSDFNKFWWKNEGEAVFEGTDEAEMETDLLYARLLTPFWYFQAGIQYASEWPVSEDYEDRWSAVIAVQGLSPYKFELDNSLYLSEDGDMTFEVDAERDIRITQRLVIQPSVTLGISAQDIPERNLGTGITDINMDLRLRYEIKREFAPYLGLRYRFLVGDTANWAEAAGSDTEHLFFFFGLRFTF